VTNVKILIVDDSALIRRSLNAQFVERSWVVCEAANGCEGIDKAQEFKPDLIVLDLAMPLLNGIDASRILRRLMPAIPIVMFTTFTDSHIKAAALAAGANVVIDKSDCALLSDSIQQLLEPSCAF
jgi:CheY-like chemotaxis protein